MNNVLNYPAITQETIQWISQFRNINKHQQTISEVGRWMPMAEAPLQGVNGGPTFTVQDETSLLRQVLRQVTSVDVAILLPAGLIGLNST